MLRVKVRLEEWTEDGVVAVEGGAVVLFIIEEDGVMIPLVSILVVGVVVVEGLVVMEESWIGDIPLLFSVAISEIIEDGLLIDAWRGGFCNKKVAEGDGVVFIDEEVGGLTI